MQGLLHPHGQGTDSSHRLIDMEWLGAGDCPRLWPHSVRYRDELHRPFQISATCLCGADAIELTSLLGKPVAFGVDMGSGTRRWLSGIVTGAIKRDGAGSFGVIDLQVESALSLLDRRRTCRIFQDQSVPQIVAAVLDEHCQRNAAIAACFTYASVLRRSHPTRSYCVQFNESDQAFIDRLLAEEGITYYFIASPQADTHGHHLVLTDTAPQQDQPPQVLHYRAQAAASRPQERQLTGWEGRTRLGPSRVELSSHDYQAAHPLHGEDLSVQVQEYGEYGQHCEQATASLTDYQAVPPYYASHTRELCTYAQLRMQAEELQARTFHGQGRLRDVSTGDSVLIQDHPAHAGHNEQQRTFVVTGIDLQLRNNIPEAWQVPPSLLEEVAPCGQGDVTDNIQLCFSAVPQDVPLVPRFAGVLDRPTANGPQTATVVGPAGEEVFTDALGRIRIQFHWQRPDEHPTGTAQVNERASTWVRVAMPSGGAGFGHQFVPRIGQEVLVAFLHNDIDRPVVIATLYNGRHAPPTFSGRNGLPGNNALSGILSREHRGEGYSELLMDDTPGQVRARLASTPFASELNLGALSTPRVDGQAQPRGAGAELRTDAALALRATHGILITSYARELAQGGQLDRQELLALLEDCAELFRGLGQAATQRGASSSDPQGLAQLHQGLREWPAAAESGESEGAAVVALAAEAGVVSATPASQLHYAGGNHDVVARDAVQSVSGGSTRLQAGHGLSLYAQDQDMQLIANRGNLLLQAQAADIQMQAQQNLQLVASEGEVVISAPRIRLVADDGSYLRIGEGIELGTPGTAVVHADTHDWRGPKTDSTTVPAFGRDPATQQHRFHYEGDVAAAAAGIDYRVALEDGEEVRQQADADGGGERVQRESMQRLKISVKDTAIDASGEAAAAAPGQTETPQEPTP